MVGTALSFATVHFIMVNIVIVASWLAVIALLARQHKEREARGTTGTTEPPKGVAGRRPQPA
jgi:hypothetical protein